MKISVILFMFASCSACAQSTNVDKLLVDSGTPGGTALSKDSKIEYLNFEPIYSNSSATFYVVDVNQMNASHEAPSTISQEQIQNIILGLKQGIEWSETAEKNELSVGSKRICIQATSQGNAVVLDFHSSKGKSQISINLDYNPDPSIGLLSGRILYFSPKTIPLLIARFERATSAIDTFKNEQRRAEKTSDADAAKSNALLKE